jgi:hypothetical protein
LGSGYALYFVFIKYSIFILSIILATSGMFNLIANLSNENCRPEGNADKFCTEDYISYTTIANSRDKPATLKTQIFLNFLTVVALILFVQFMRYRMRKIAIDVDDLTTTPSDYTVILEGVPTNITDRQLKDWLYKFETPENHLEIEKVIRTWEIKDFVKTEKLKTEIQQRLAQPNVKAKEYEHQLKEIERDLRRIKRKQALTPVAFVIFKRAQRKTILLF